MPIKFSGTLGLWHLFPRFHGSQRTLQQGVKTHSLQGHHLINAVLSLKRQHFHQTAPPPSDTDVKGENCQVHDVFGASPTLPILHHIAT